MSIHDDLKGTRLGPMQPRNEWGGSLSRLRDERKRRGWLQSDLAEKVGVSKVTVSRWESGGVLPQPHYCRKLCEVLGLGLEDLFPEGPTQLPTDEDKAMTSIVLPGVSELRQVRWQRGLSQAELADAVGTTRESVNRWERGLGSPNLPHLRKLCGFLRVLPEELFPDTISTLNSPTPKEAEEIRTHLSTVYSSGQHFFDY